jgi:hypothetical protein
MTSKIKDSLKEFIKMMMILKPHHKNYFSSYFFVFTHKNCIFFLDFLEENNTNI